MPIVLCVVSARELVCVCVCTVCTVYARARAYLCEYDLYVLHNRFDAVNRRFVCLHYGISSSFILSQLIQYVPIYSLAWDLFP